VRWLPVTGRDARLEALDFGGEGTGVLLLHGLAGTAVEWEETAAWLSATHRVVALDQRGHGRSERRPREVTPAAYVDDALAAVETLVLAPAILVGQSLGGLIAFLAASERPDLVGALIVVEATPTREGPEVAEQIADYFDSWPLPFPSHDAAVTFFGGESLRACAWARNLVTQPDGLRPAFDADVLVAAIEQALARDYWDEWRALSVPTLLVRGEEGELSPSEAAAMVAAVPSAQLVSIPGAGHDVHLDAPEAWRSAVEAFLSRLS
jgi:pimeloyl-ACP methyl ester carboxylesterase